MIREDGSLRLIPRIVLALVALALTVYALGDAVTLSFVVSYTAVGVLLAIRRPRNAVGWLLVAIAITFVATTTPGDIDVAALQAGTATLRDQLVVWIGSWSGGLSWLLFATLAMVFPTGHLPEGRWRRLSIAALTTGILLELLSVVATPYTTAYTDAQPEGVDVPLSLSILPLPVELAPILAVALVVLLGVIFVGIGLLLVRYRRADEETRLQIRWVLAAIVFVLAAILTGLGLTLATGGLGGIEWIPAVISYPTIPLAIAIAIFRYRLYEIDRIVNRAIVYGSVTAILAGVLAAASTFSQRLLSELAGGSSEFAIVAITLVVATLYAPLRKRVETVVDRYFKYEQRQFGGYRDELRQISALIDPARAASRLADETLAETRATGVAVVDRMGKVVASAGEWPVAAEARVTVNGAASPIGAVLVGPRRDGRPHASSTMHALAEVAALADVVARAGVEAPSPVASVSVAATSESHGTRRSAPT